MTRIAPGSNLLTNLAIGHHVRALDLELGPMGTLSSPSGKLMSSSGKFGQAALDAVAPNGGALDLEGLASLQRFGGRIASSSLERASAQSLSALNLSLGGLALHLTTSASKVAEGLSKADAARLEARAQEASKSIERLKSELDLSSVSPALVRETVDALRTLARSVSTFGEALSAERERALEGRSAGTDAATARYLGVTGFLLEGLGSAARLLSAPWPEPRPTARPSPSSSDDASDLFELRRRQGARG